MLYSAQLYQTLSPPNASLESREAACYVTIRLFASLSCCRGRAGRRGRSHGALGCDENSSGRRNAGRGFLFLQTSGRLQQTLPGAAGDFATLRQPVVPRIMGPSWRHGPPVGPPCHSDTQLSGKKKKKMWPSSPCSLCLHTCKCTPSGPGKPLQFAREEDNEKTGPLWD